MDAILKPLGEKVVEFRQKVEKESEERNTLKGVIQNLMDMSKKMNEDTTNLTKALKGDSKMQGDWGEMILEKILESSGLRKDHEYSVQESLTTETGRNLRPDIIISYPDNRKVIIDSKVSLTAYARYINAQSPEEQQLALKEHIISVQKHINELSEQNYQKYVPSLDFVMMFVPIEFALLLALQNNPELWNYAYKKGVLLISPTNLIAALKLIEDLWKREHQNKNAQDIADRGALLYEKFVGFVENLSDIGVSLDKAKTSYDKAYGQLKDGRGNLVEQAEKLKEMGVKTKKTLPSNLLQIPENNSGVQ
jgi:DNA recombination protein RmuC